MRFGSTRILGAAAFLCIAAHLAVPAVAAGKPPAGRIAASVRAAANSDLLRIVALRAEWQRALNAHDLDGVLQAYASGAVIHAEGAPPFLGVGDIARWHDRWAEGSEVQYDADARLARISGRYAVEEWSAFVTVTPRADPLTGIGGDVYQFRQGGVRVYRKDSAGRWRIDRETWSADPLAVQQFAAAATAMCARVLC